MVFVKFIGRVAVVKHNQLVPGDANRSGYGFHAAGMHGERAQDHRFQASFPDASQHLIEVGVIHLFFVYNLILAAPASA